MLGFWPFTSSDDAHYAEQQAEVACVEKANNNPKALLIEKEIRRLSTTWKPTGYYRPEDVDAVIAKLNEPVEDVGLAIKNAPDSTRNAADNKREAFNEIILKVIRRSESYADELKRARAEGATIIDAPGLKSFLIAGMQSIANGYITAAMLHCQQSWLESLLDKAYRFIMAVADFAASIGGLIVDVADTVYRAGRATLGFAATVAKYAPYVIAGLGGYLAFVVGRGQYRRLVARAEGPIDWGAVFKRKPKQISGARHARRTRRGKSWR